MKKLRFKILGISLLALLVIGGCENLLDFTFTSDGSSVTFIVEPEVAGEHVEQQQVLKADLDSLIAAEGKNAGDLKSVHLNEATAEVVGSGNFDAVQSIEIKLKAAGLDEIVLASKSNVAEGLTFETLDVYSGDLAAYLNSAQYTLTLVVFLDQDLVNPLTVKAILKYKITVGV